MGLINQVIRGIKQLFRNLWNSIPFIKKKKKRHIHDEDMEIPASWQKESRPGDQPGARKQIVVQKHKIRVPGLRTFKRLLAGFLLFVNFVFSQFLLGRVGDQGQVMFLLFLANSFILADYLWKTRRTS